MKMLSASEQSPPNERLSLEDEMISAVGNESFKHEDASETQRVLPIKTH